MRGQRTTISKKRADLVLVANRFEQEGSRVALAQGYERRGLVWSDLKLFSREDLLSRLKAGQRVFAGKLGSLEGDFDLSNQIVVTQAGGEEWLFAGGNGASGDDLGLPLF